MSSPAITRHEPGPRMAQAVVHNGMVYLAGIVGDESRDFRGQAETCLAEIDRLLALSGSDRAHILQATVWLTDMANFATFNEVWEGWIDPAHPPARATGRVELVAPEYLIEIIVVAAQTAG